MAGGKEELSHLVTSEATESTGEGGRGGRDGPASNLRIDVNGGDAPGKLASPDSSGPSSAKLKWSRLSTRDLLASQGSGGVKVNGLSKKPDLSRADSLNVPGEEGDGSPRSEKSLESRRGSSRSLDSRMSGLDFSKLAGAQQQTTEEEEETKPKNVITDDSYIRSAIPYLPPWVAVICLLLNIFLPGFGTMLSGLSILCCGRTRVNTKDDPVTTTLCVNVWVGAAQLFTITFMLVGWFWSLAWGIYMIILAVEHQQEQKNQREKQLQAMALTAFNPQVRPWSIRT